ncbi:glycoside hydrolase family 32 protein [Anaerobiospirillum sp. NML120449]|uniref:glycoside hydrolase family 32 protein n=1 Tax=Anaerobiospirillum sp. NML120449 TaxID=2932817 RepID=UPI001FF47013|nr:glycoside hydrolase family 32 protein [Anaerobiospirillum sp. NML120449]MCK0527146.1 glycoside hydrolase family 32 protein [Anaerobiospirillum sp. NML120449]
MDHKRHQELVNKANEYIESHSNEVNRRLYPGYHLAARTGWINDPNGFCYALGKYHIFYQFYPYDAQWGPMHWGHAVSDDLIHWEHVPVALAPSEDFDKDGCFSGSAIEHDGKLYLMYTGHVVTGAEGDNSQVREVQALAVSEDGINFTKLGTVIEPEDGITNFRDPKVWKDDKGQFHVVFGVTNLQGAGEIRQYVSEDLKNWKQISIIKEMEDQAFMYECPDFFEVNDNKWVLATSPMGQAPEGYTRQNTSVNSWQSGSFDGLNFVPDSKLYEVDRGHDFYATQSTATPDGRRVVIAWMNMWRLPYLSAPDRWCGALTLPRVITWKDGHLYQQPVEETKSLRLKEYSFDNSATRLTSTVKHINNSSALELLMKFKPSDNDAEQYGLAIGNSIRLFVDRQTRTLTMFRTDLNATSYRALPLEWDKEHELHIFIDSSSIEVFVDHGHDVMTTNFFGADHNVSLYATNGTAAIRDVKVYELDRPFLTV